jgi:hypothetical protein
MVSSRRAVLPAGGGLMITGGGFVRAGGGLLLREVFDGPIVSGCCVGGGTYCLVWEGDR